MNAKRTFTSLAEARKYANLSQISLAKKAGVIQADISRIETGLANPTLNVLKRIAAALDMRLKIVLEEKK